MADYIITNYLTLLNYSLAGSFILLFVWELVLPWIRADYSVPLRWWNTIPLYLIGRYLTFWLLPITIIPAAIYAESNAIGLLNMWAEDPIIGVFISLLLYDMFHYFLHWIFHRIPALWRLHRLHHSDPDVDIITELKHHPFETLVASLLAVIAVIVLGLHPVAIVIRTLAAQAISLASHANVRLPNQVDRIIRLILITPAMHRIHHSSFKIETDSNYGTLFSFWDRLFNTYVESPQGGYQQMQLGLEEFRSERDLWLDRMLLQPFIKTAEHSVPLADSKSSDD